MQEARLRAIGLPLDDIPQLPAADRPPAARARRCAGSRCMRYGYLGPEAQLQGPGPEATEILFDQTARASTRRGQGRHDAAVGLHRPRAVAPRASTTARRARSAGAAPNPTITLRSSFEDFVDLGAGRADPRRLMLRRRLRPKGDLRAARALPKLFG